MNFCWFYLNYLVIRNYPGFRQLWVTHGVNMSHNFLTVIHVQRKYKFQFIIIQQTKTFFNKKNINLNNKIYFYEPVRIYFCFEPTIQIRTFYNICKLCLLCSYQQQKDYFHKINWPMECALILNNFQNSHLDQQKFLAPCSKNFIFTFSLFKILVIFPL